MSRIRTTKLMAIATGLAMFAGSVQAQTVGIATSNPGSLFHNIGTAVANAANKAGLNTTIQPATSPNQFIRSEEHTSELQSHHDLVCRLLLEKHNNYSTQELGFLH